MQTVIVVLASQWNAIVTESALTLNPIDLARLITAKLFEVAIIATLGNTNFVLVAIELILDVATLWIATYVLIIN